MESICCISDWRKERGVLETSILVIRERCFDIRKMAETKLYFHIDGHLADTYHRNIPPQANV